MEERIRELEQQFGRKLTAREKFYVAMEEAVRDKAMAVPRRHPSTTMITTTTAAEW